MDILRIPGGVSAFPSTATGIAGTCTPPVLYRQPSKPMWHQDVNARPVATNDNYTFYRQTHNNPTKLFTTSTPTLSANSKAAAQ